MGEHFAQLKDGRKICYFKDGEGIPMICLHGGGESKWYFMQKEPIPGVQLISIDRYGYGRTDTIPGRKITDYSWDEMISDMQEFLDVLGFSKVIWWGFSIGSSWAQHCAAGLPDRTHGIVICGTMADTNNELMTKEEKGKVGCPPKILHPTLGCLGFILRGVFTGLPAKIEKHDFGDSFKPDFQNKKARIRYDKMIADDFWIASKIDGLLGNTRGEALMGDAIRSLCSPWKYGPQDVQCPIYIFQADADGEIPVLKLLSDTFIPTFSHHLKSTNYNFGCCVLYAPLEDMGSSSPTSSEFIKRVAPNVIALEWLLGAGHSFTVGPDDDCRGHVMKAIAAMVPPLK